MTSDTRYMIICHIPFAITDEGRFAVDKLWGWDLDEHLKHYKNLHVYAPVEKYDPKIHDFTFTENTISFHVIPYPRKMREFFLDICGIAAIFFHDFKKEDIIHYTGTGSYFLAPVANAVCLVKGCRHRILVIDSDVTGDLQLQIQKGHSIAGRIVDMLKYVYYYLAIRFCIKNSNLIFVVGDRLYEKYSGINHIIKIYASWIRENDIIQNKDIDEKIADYNKRKDIRICYASSLTYKKNPACAVETAHMLKEMGLDFVLEIYGKGPEKEALDQLVEKYSLGKLVNFKGYIPYGEAFYKNLRSYDALMIPNMSGEQPRVLFDGLANGLVVICSNIKSINGVIVNMENGILCDPHNYGCYASHIKQMINERYRAEGLMNNGLETVKQYTLRSMHDHRTDIINDMFK
jgi:glycosyltransferase involved in cell wall biosynthesis